MTKAMYTTNNGVKEEILIGSNSEFYKDIAERLIKESVSNGTRVKVNVDVPDEGDASYMVSQRSGTMFITETGNNMPDKFLDKEIKPRFLTCVNPETNAYKFYKLDVLDDKTVRASYGRMGVKKGELFGERSFDYPLSMYWIKYYEKIQKGYVDRTDIYLTDNELICIRVLFYFLDLSDYHAFHFFTEMLAGFQVGTGHDHSVTELLIGNIYIDIIIQPLDWN